jgi:hypothetical protein
MNIDRRQAAVLGLFFSVPWRPKEKDIPHHRPTTPLAEFMLFCFTGHMRVSLS